MALDIPAKLASKAAEFPESSYGACRATLVLRGGRRIFDVTLASGSTIVQLDGQRVEKEAQLGFRLADVADVVPWP